MIHIEHNPTSETVLAMLTAEQVAEVLGIHVNTVYRLIGEGRIAAHNLSRNTRRPTWRISPSAVEGFLQESGKPVPIPAKPRSYHRRRKTRHAPSEKTFCCSDGSTLPRLA